MVYSEWTLRRGSQGCAARRKRASSAHDGTTHDSSAHNGTAHLDASTYLDAPADQLRKLRRRERMGEQRRRTSFPSDPSITDHSHTIHISTTAAIRSSSAATCGPRSGGATATPPEVRILSSLRVVEVESDT